MCVCLHPTGINPPHTHCCYSHLLSQSSSSGEEGCICRKYSWSASGSVPTALHSIWRRLTLSNSLCTFSSCCLLPLLTATATHLLCGSSSTVRLLLMLVLLVWKRAEPKAFIMSMPKVCLCLYRCLGLKNSWEAGEGFDRSSGHGHVADRCAYHGIQGTHIHQVFTTHPSPNNQQTTSTPLSHFVSAYLTLCC